MSVYELTSTTSGKGSLHPFVAGLLFSSSIMEEMSRVAPQGLHLSWGQILDKNDVLSKEIDIIAFEGKPLCHWANTGFSIISQENVKFVIECMRNFSNTEEMKNALKNLSRFSKYVYLSIYEDQITTETMKKKEQSLRDIEFKDVFYLLRWEKDEKSLLYENWHRLLELVSRSKSPRR
jgi:hypothetical protein